MKHLSQIVSLAIIIQKLMKYIGKLDEKVKGFRPNRKTCIPHGHSLAVTAYQLLLFYCLYNNLKLLHKPTFHPFLDTKLKLPFTNLPSRLAVAVLKRKCV